MIPKGTRILTGAVLSMVLSGPLFSVDFNTPEPAAKLVNALLAQMSDEECLAQTFMLGWVGSEPSPLISEWIRERKLGGIKIFGWNTEDTQRLAATVGTLQSMALEGTLKIPLLIATDQEGGWIRHVKGITSETPGNMAIGASGYPRDAYLSGYYIGRELAALGINMNFAPTVDLFINKDSQLIGPRAFGDDPVHVGTLGAAFAKGLERAGVIGTAKHFPGHGATDQDSHGVLPQIEASFELLWERELIPYRMLVKEDVSAIMSGHLAFVNTPGGYEPASLSPWFLKDLLREKMGYRGVIITDDLMMNGATHGTGSLSRSAKQAIEAGNDIIMLSQTPRLNDAVWSYLVESMEDDSSFRVQVRDAARRVLLLKLNKLRGDNAPPLFPDPEEVLKRVPDPEGAAFFQDLAVRSVTLYGGGKDTIPLSAELAGRVLLAGQYKDFLEVGSLAFPEAEHCVFSNPGDGRKFEDQDELHKKAARADTVIVCLANQYSLDLLQGLRDMEIRVIAISVLSPVYLDQAAWIDGALAVYSYSRESFVAAFSALIGRIEAQGMFPYPSQAPEDP